MASPPASAFFFSAAVAQTQEFVAVVGHVLVGRALDASVEHNA
jgi:hypothetical protein